MEEVQGLPVITISREYGAGGRSIARGLAERLGIPFYDRDFVKKTAEESGYSEEDIRREGEQMSRMSKFMNSFLNNAAVYESSYDGIFQAQKKVILELSESPCIIIGRCSNVILRQAGIPSFNIYLYADTAHRVKRAEELAENGTMDIERYIAKRDELRHTYYRTYTGHAMGYCSDYHICLDTGMIGYEKAVDILAEILLQKG